jgi:hypothetical protein
MTDATERRRKLLRLRTIQAKAADMRVVEADAHLESLFRIKARLSSLRQSLVPTHGETDGLALKSMAEMAQRIDAADTRLTDPILDARHGRDTAQAERILARRNEESASRLHQRAALVEELARDQRDAAQRVHRRPRVGLRDRMA